MTEFMNEHMKKGSNALDRVEEFLFPGDIEIEGTGYQRSLLDRRVEKYLDKHFDEYIEEFNLLREIDLHVYEEKLARCEEDVEEIREFQKDVDDEIDSFKARLDRIEEELK
ncbi:MAG: hypothetical protein ACLFVL_01440 [Candidatus Aenigmatarchaeota archaeon]